MEKISGIIKSSPRVQAVDIRESGAVRPGTPSFGRPQGVSSLAKLEMAKPELEASLTTANRAIAVNEELVGWKAKDQINANLAAELSNKFFSKPSLSEDAMPSTVGAMNLPAALPPMERASNPAGFKTDSVGSFRAKADVSMPSRSMNFNALPDTAPVLAQPEGLFPRGSFIDRVA